MSTSEDLGLYHPDLDRISVPQHEDDIANNPGVSSAAVRVMQANITQARHQFKAMHDQFSTWEYSNARQKSEIASIQDQNNDLMTKNTKANLPIAKLQSRITDATSTTSLFTDECQFSEKFPDPKLYDRDKQKLRSWDLQFECQIRR